MAYIFCPTSRISFQLWTGKTIGSHFLSSLKQTRPPRSSCSCVETYKIPSWSIFLLFPSWWLLLLLLGFPKMLKPNRLNSPMGLNLDRSTRQRRKPSMMLRVRTMEHVGDWLITAVLPSTVSFFVSHSHTYTHTPHCLHFQKGRIRKHTYSTCF